MEEKYHLLLIDDESEFRYLTKLDLENEGFSVIEAADGREGLALMRSEKPDLVLLDLNMPDPDGHKICEMIRDDEAFQNTPVIILTTSDDLNDKLKRLDGGADDYITKSIDPKERVARIKAVIRRNLQNLDCNPLTRLPGNTKIQEMILKWMQNGVKFAVAYTDLDNFKAFNDKYGFDKGDAVILFTAEVIKESVRLLGEQSDFIGHIGGDDFVVLTSPERLPDICNKIIEMLDTGITKFYNDEDRKEGFIETKNRQGISERFPVISISIAAVNNRRQSFTNIGEIVKIVTELKKFAKQKDGSCLVLDKRTE